MLPRIRALLLSLPVVVAIIGTGFVSLASLAAVGYIPLPDGLGLRSRVQIPPVPEIGVDDTSIDSTPLDDVQLTSIAIIAERDARLARLAAQYSLQLLNQSAFPRGSNAAADGFLSDSLRHSAADAEWSSTASPVEEIPGTIGFAGANTQFGGANGELDDANNPPSVARSFVGGGSPFDSIRRNGQLDLANLGLFQENFGHGSHASDTSASIFPTVPPQVPETPASVVPGGGSGNSTPPGGPPKDPPNNPPNNPPGDPVDVPEPATMSMLALGVGMMWLSRGRRGRGVSHY